MENYITIMGVGVGWGVVVVVVVVVVVMVVVVVVVVEVVVLAAVVLVVVERREGHHSKHKWRKSYCVWRRDPANTEKVVTGKGKNCKTYCVWCDDQKGNTVKVVISARGRSINLSRWCVERPRNSVRK